MEQHGHAVRFNNDNPDSGANFYGWSDWEIDDHTRTGPGGCRWTLADGAIITEQTYRQFTDTFHDAENEIGINAAPANCACGRYTNRHLRYTGTLGAVLVTILKDEDTNGIRL